MASVHASWAQVPADLISGNLPVQVSSIAIVDLNGDGFSDIVFVSKGASLGRLEGIDGSASASHSYPKATTVGHLLGSRFTPPLCRPIPLYVHALDGSATPPYSRELPDAWPRQINGCSSLHPTVAIGDVNFDGQLDVLVGGMLEDCPPDGLRAVFAFAPDGHDVPGWECVPSEFPPFFNAFAFADVNLDGSPDVVAVDESTYLHRFNALPTAVDPARKWRRQCQLVDDPVWSSPAIGDVGQRGMPRADGIPDEVSTGVESLGPVHIQVYDSFGKQLGCNDSPPPDRLFQLNPPCIYASSPALVDLDGDRTQDVVIQCGAFFGTRLQVFASSQGFEEVSLPSGSPLLATGYCSPAIADLEGPGSRNIVIGSDGGRVHAFRYDPARPAGQRIVPLWQTAVLDPGVCDGFNCAVSSSPIAADLDGDGVPEIVAATDAGNVYLLSPADGSTIASYSLANGQPWDVGAAVWSTAAVGRRAVGDPPMIVAGNRRGIFKILTKYPPFDPAAAPWPTFHRSNARTGALAPKQDGSMDPQPSRGSIGGIATECTGVALWDRAGQNPIPDYYTGDPAATVPRSDGRFVFELLTPADYRVRFSGPNPPNDLDVTVTAGAMSPILASCTRSSPGRSAVIAGKRAPSSLAIAAKKSKLGAARGKVIGQQVKSSPGP